MAHKARKKLKPDKFFMGKPTQNYKVSPKYCVTQFYLQPEISEHTPTLTLISKAITRFTYPEGWKAELT